MNYLKVFVLFLFLTSCGCSSHSEKQSEIKLSQLEKLDYYRTEVTNFLDYVDKCDALTFAGLWDAYGKSIKIFDFEYSFREDGKRIDRSGQWHRNPEVCFPDESRSEVSLEIILGALRSIWERKDLPAIERFLKYANRNNWVLGLGPLEYTYLPQVFLIANKIKDKLSSREERGGVLDEIEIIKKLSGYRGKVIANFIELHARVAGKMSDFELQTIDFIRVRDETNPIYAAIYWKYTGKQKYFDIANGFLDDESIFPSQGLPGHIDSVDWGDEAGFAIYAWICSILYGTTAI